MATIKFRVRGSKNPSPIYLRFINGRDLDIEVKINIFIDPAVWDSKNNKIRNVISVPNRDKMNSQLSGLSNHVYNSYNESFAYGEVLDKNWLEGVVASFFKRPKGQVSLGLKPELVYVYDFGNWWLDNKASTWKSLKFNSMPKRTIGVHRNALCLFKEFEDGEKIKFSQLDNDLVYRFLDFLDEKNYAPSSAKKFFDRIRFLINRASAEGVKNIGAIDGKIYYKKSDGNNVEVPYLNEDEIKKIMDLDLSDKDDLDAVRDNFIISLWTGLRISDFNKNLDVKNIDGDYINIKTGKTGEWVLIPMHPNVKRVLNKRAGALPSRTTNYLFNTKVKKVVKLAGIDNLMKGSIFDRKVNRKVEGVYPKYKLISAHTGRRSFATNLYGLVHNSVIMAVGGWKQEDMMLHYIKKTKSEHSEILKEKWDQKYNTK